MKNVIGTPARGESFYPRNHEIRKIVAKLDDGNNLNISAPRRVGKTSILYGLMDQGIGGYTYTYIDTEDIETESEFFRRVQKEVLRTEAIRNSRRLKGLLESGHKYLSKVKAIKLLGQGVEFAEEAAVADSKEDLINLLSGLEIENSRGIVILMDEFPQTVQNIIDKNIADLSSVRKFLQANREVRQHPEINQKVRFVMTGSIGLNHTVSQVGMTAFINDLNSVEVGQLNMEDAMTFLEELFQPKGIIAQDVTKQYVVQKIGWLIPFHIQLLVQEIFSLCRPGSVIENDLIDRAFEAIIQQRNENHFNHYYSRLKRQFKDRELAFASNLLDFLAVRASIGKAAIRDMSVKYELEEKWRGIVEILIYDGYIVNDSYDQYRFNSPVVRMWWKRFICN